MTKQNEQLKKEMEARIEELTKKIGEEQNRDFKYFLRGQKEELLKWYFEIF